MTYARMLGEKLDRHRSTVWLVNTGWTGGAFGEGHRMPIQATRDLLHAALSGALEDAEFRVDDVFGFEVPVEVPGVERSLLTPRDTWRDPQRYDEKARELAQMFADNFESKFPDADPAVRSAGPKPG
jgi:phosphoenolpyruvate carboxykinase (ATP)